jgi:hypothetical protein
MASLIRMAQEEGAVSDSVAPPYPLDRVVAYVGVVRICQLASENILSTRLLDIVLYALLIPKGPRTS